jgi:hypothetical protein
MFKQKNIRLAILEVKRMRKLFVKAKAFAVQE